MFTLQKLPTLAGLADDTTDPGFDFQAFFDSDQGQNITANILNMFAKQQGTTAVFKNPNGTFGTPTQSVDPLWIIGGVVAVGLLAFMNKGKR